MSDTTTCVECGTRGRSAYQFRKATPEQRHQWLGAGIRRIEARGLCQPCYRVARLAGTLTTHPRRNRSTDEILEDWQHLADPLLPVRQECVRLAGQFGMHWRSLERAVSRAGVRSRFTDFANGVKVAA